MGRDEATADGRSKSALRVLVVEDDFNIARLLAVVLEAEGIETVGPVGTLSEALALVSQSERIDAAVLDINLQGEMVYPVADVLRRKGVAIVFTTGYDEPPFAPSYGDIPRLQKPVSPERLIRTLFG